MIHHDIALHQRHDERWDCYSIQRSGIMIGYCLSPEMVGLCLSGHPVEGLSWAELSNPANREVASAVARCPWITEEEWERDRQLRIAHREDFHGNGHATEAGAIACYRKFLGDFGLTELAELQV